MSALTKMTNLIACLFVAGLFGGMALGAIDQDFLKPKFEEWLFAPAIWFGLFGLGNLRG